MGSLIAAAVLLGLVNAIVRPIVFLLTLPFVLITFGLFLIIINAAMLELVAMMLKGFSVESFWPAAILGSLIISLVSWVGSWFIHQGHSQR
jgi:putative membrane protein